MKILVLGQCSSMYYNIYVSEAVTRQGRSYISCSIMLFEAFLGNNVKFNSLNEVITFIHNVVHEKNERELVDSYILDRDITKEECFFKLLNNADPLIWVPTKKEMSLVWERLRGVSKEDINRLYYKNNLYSFADLPIVSDLIIKILCTLQEPFILSFWRRGSRSMSIPPALSMQRFLPQMIQRQWWER